MEIVVGRVNIFWVIMWVGGVSVGLGVGISARQVGPLLGSMLGRSFTSICEDVFCYITGGSFNFNVWAPSWVDVWGVFVNSISGDLLSES